MCDCRLNGLLRPETCIHCRQSLGLNEAQLWHAYMTRASGGSPWSRYQGFDDVMTFTDD